MKKIIKNIMNLISSILIVIGVATVILFIIPSVLGYKPFVVISGSMEPSIKVGAVAYNNTHKKVENVKIGDVIVFKIDNGNVTHRVIKINDDRTFITKGDANQTEDFAPVKFENFQGETVFTIPYLGKFLKLIQNKIGIFILVTAVGLNIIYAIFSDEDNKEEGSKKDESKFKNKKQKYNNSN